ncbi:MAG TPA: TonB-dependent receptor [Balneola sp.]|nr:TonB-dependent receptor [Balneola sp.]|tara:strand:+ start:2343 stop:4613 length:2271 start_codon:yes stop_codon:yes gene_type:complete
MRYISIFTALFLLMITTLSFGQSSSFSVSGSIYDNETNETIPFAYIHLEELNRTAVSNIDGEFEIKNIPSGTYTLTTHRIGYRTQSKAIELLSENLKLDIRLNISVLSSEAIEVVGKGNELTGSGLEHASKNIFGSDLRRNLGSTLSETLSNLPGFDQRSNGAAPGRPVIRGLGDERVMILQDGINSGDVSSQSADHSVTIDPVSATEIEIARGPAALAYGSNAIGGVINVVKNQVQTTLPSHLTGTLSINGQTVNSGLSSALNIAFPVSSFAVQADINGRYGLNTETPRGEIGNSYYETTNDAIGVSWIRPWGYAGISTSLYFSNYGIPPDPNGHPNGVDIELRKYQYDARSEILLNNDLLKLIEMDISFKDYNHKEIEGENSEGEPVVGTEFDLLTTNFNLRAKHNKFGFLNSGSFGISGEFEDYTVDGTGTPPSNNFELGAYIIEETDISELHLEVGARLDYSHASTNERGLFYGIGARSGSIDSTFYKNRSFSALSGSISAIYDLGGGFSIGSTILRSFRAPSLEELYSEGPHLASYSFEIGNPDLDPERAWAKEIFIGFQSNKINTSAALFHNGFDNYLYARNTGKTNIQRADLLNYQFVGTEAELYGVESSAEFQLTNTIVFDVSASYTIGKQDTTDQNGNNKGTRPLPQIPPFKAQSSIKYAKDGLEIGTRFKYAARQDRTGEFENPTDSYFLTDLFAQYRINGEKLLHTISVNVNNLLNEEYYNHLSRIKDLRPEPGRNFTVLYRIYF